jgi:hypothetical protein
MKQTEQRFLVNDFEVVLVRDQHGVRWECKGCPAQCEHILQAAAWLTLQSWDLNGRPNLH